MSTARQLAIEVLCGVAGPSNSGSGSTELRRGGVREAIDRKLKRSRLSARDSALLTELVYGSVRHFYTLDTVIAKFSKPPLQRLDTLVLAALRVGLYQILCLDRVPDAAAVHETVQLVKEGTGKRATSFVNGVLRAICRDIQAKNVSDLQAPDRRRAVHAREGRFALFKSDLLPDPATRPAEWLAQAYSLPTWLVKRWLTRFGFDDTERRCSVSNRTPHLFVRANRRRTTRDELLSTLAANAVDGTSGPWPESIDLGPGLPIGKLLPALNEGLCSVQDHTAMQVAPHLDPQPDESILEVCAAPGGKTTHLAELSDDRATIVAVDVSPDGMARITENARRLRLESVVCVRGDALHLPLSGVFDKVLLDVPCSNTGVLARRVDARWRLRESDITRLRALQAKLIRAAGEYVRPGGLIVYSTCSTELEENQHLVQEFVAQSPEFRLLGDEEFLPPAVPGDGGYMAKIERRLRS